MQNTLGAMFSIIIVLLYSPVIILRLLVVMWVSFFYLIPYCFICILIETLLPFATLLSPYIFTFLIGIITCGQDSAVSINT